MNILLYVDEYCYFHDGNYYLESFGLLLIKRYLNVFDHIKVPIRVREVETKQELERNNCIVDDSRIEIVPLPFGQGAKAFIKHYKKIKKALKRVEKDIDLAVLRLPSIYSFAVLDKVRKAHIPYAIEIVFDCYDGYASSKSMIGKMSWKWMHKKQQVACRDAIGISCVTERYLQKRYNNDNPRVIKAHYSSIELPESFYYKARNYPENKHFQIIHIAYQVAFNSRKGHNQLLEALSIVRRKGYDVSVVFVGGDYNNGISQLKEYARSLGVSESVSFAGFLSRPELRNLLMQSNLAVLPTKAEGLPRVVIESMAMGLPCISSNVSGNPELLDEEYLLEYSDIDALANTIIHVISDSVEYESVSARNFENSKKYEASNLDKARNKFYKELKERVIKASNK